MAAYRHRDQEIQERHRVSLYRAIFQRYCTERVRKYGGPDGPQSACFPTRYAGIGRETSARVETKSTRRIEVSFDPVKAISEKTFCFVLLRRQGECGLIASDIVTLARKNVPAASCDAPG